jgi:hypothetical protein
MHNENVQVANKILVLDGTGKTGSRILVGWQK